MNTSKKHWGWPLWASLFSVAAASAVGFCVGYQNGFNAYYRAYIDALIENVHYVGNPADCPECNEEETYEWFYVDPPCDSHLPEEDFLTAKQEGGEAMGP